MSWFNNPIPRGGLPDFHESSNMRSPRDADQTAVQWKRSSVMSAQLLRASNAIEQLQRQLNRLRFHPGTTVTGGGMQFLGEWNSGQVYAVQNVVNRNVLGAFLCLTVPPAGTAPETGAPYWYAWGYPAPGVWA